MNLKRMFLFMTLGLSACQTKPSEASSPPVALEVLDVKLPDSVGASEALTVTVSVADGGCYHFTNFEAKQRSASRLAFSVQGRPLAGSVGCPPVTGRVAEVYTDPGTPARTNPFEVFVNGKSYGTVSVK
ncbi:hypothetical protein FNU79_00845 [Deinococcus detaillensis]|uniref:Lipoprotein n=1 Tax=Deinococcus detaillensis TaxID=2592048 RepID=A0A553V5T4_9DEIO|nr:hypothetical protein [Deinococcus detaillensis]TSA87833.1 hypothetical protein FNU79_00845 [Deinococcus detaillensis]